KCLLLAAHIHTPAARELTGDTGAANRVIAIEHEAAAAAAPAACDPSIANGARCLCGRIAVLTDGNLTLRGMRLTRNHINRSAERVGAMNRGGGAVDHFYPLDSRRHERDVPVVVSALTVVQTHAVDEHQTLAECRATDREVR